MLILLAISVVLSQVFRGTIAETIFTALAALLMIMMVLKSVIWIKKEIQ
jgi:hypothetical protein